MIRRRPEGEVQIPLTLRSKVSRECLADPIGDCALPVTYTNHASLSNSLLPILDGMMASP